MFNFVKTSKLVVVDYFKLNKKWVLWNEVSVLLPNYTCYV